MVMSEYEKQEIVRYASFLEDKGYTKNIKNNHVIDYSSQEIDIGVVFEPYDDFCDVCIIFKKENEAYYVGWIARVKGNLNINLHQRLETIRMLLSFVKENYSAITDINYCRESRKLVDEFIENAKKKRSIE